MLSNPIGRQRLRSVTSHSCGCNTSLTNKTTLTTEAAETALGFVPENSFVFMLLGTPASWIPGFLFLHHDRFSAVLRCLPLLFSLFTPGIPVRCSVDLLILFPSLSLSPFYLSSPLSSWAEFWERQRGTVAGCTGWRLLGGEAITSLCLSPCLFRGERRYYPPAYAWCEDWWKLLKHCLAYMKHCIRFRVLFQFTNSVLCHLLNWATEVLIPIF